jgi:hypothetical protein
MTYPLLEDPMPVISKGGYETTEPIQWLRKHPRCKVALCNEYGDREEL